MRRSWACTSPADNSRRFGRLGAVAARRAAVEGRGVAPGRPLGGGLRGVADARPGRRRDSLSAARRVVSEGPVGQAARPRAGAGHDGRARRRRARGARHAAGRRREHGGMARRRPAVQARHLGHAGVGRDSTAIRFGHGAARRVADAGDPALHGAQAAQPDREGAGPAARGARGGLPADDLRARPPRWCSSVVGVRARSGGCSARRSLRASRKPATSCSRSCASRGRSGRRCARRTRWSGSTRSSAVAPRRRPACRARTPSSCCCSVCCARVTVKSQVRVGLADILRQHRPSVSQCARASLDNYRRRSYGLLCWT